MGESDPLEDLTSTEASALQEVERGLEEFRRAHGALVEYHHAVGRGIEHFEAAGEDLPAEHVTLADRIEEEILPAGVTADGKLTYQVVAEFEDGILPTVEALSADVFETLADGERYPIERRERGEND